ncbi:PREDICTED: adhesion G protein-coupled receptor L4-like [Acropora digitifera]|uniref:adhesion G protein-coupled receptor L4-like n=1 Tax=Acropora digitifera TaxID=70779 RepID=UPI00077A26D0|nr:PREDICTED: adhesion G protein-coupled receptor L4-like [Acropora digitifera]XP_015757734.1 PREDICTED: adhesion G protein-coupled receptor L4-like [Acropora digitifera]XP_015757741.1 PREDICTED: adhesion G protein-coupled receptor L4-like [Acropora digitifera]
MKLFCCTWAVLFLSMLFVLENVAMGAKGKRCSSTPLVYNGLNKALCELLVRGALGKYRTIECRQYSSIWGCISNFCRDVSSCLNQTWKWRYLCEQRFYWSRFGKFGVTASKEDQNGTYIRNLQLGFCHPTFSHWSLIVKSYKFSIRTTEYFCHSEKQANEDDDGGYAAADNMTDLDLSTKITYDLSTLDVLNNNSLKEAVNTSVSKIEEFINSTIFSGQTGNTTTTNHEIMQRVLMATVAFEKFVFKFADIHLSESAPVMNFTSEKIDLQVRRAFWENETDFHLEDAKNYIKLPSTNIHNGSTILGVMYKDLHRMFAKTSTEQDTPGISSKNLNTIITSVTMRAQSDKLRENVVLGFKNVQPSSRNRECVFWNFSASDPTGWLDHGCHISSMDNYGTECSCNHLTHFAVLVQFDASAGGSNSLLTKADESALIIVTRVGLVLSLIGIALTITCYVFLADIKAPLSQIRVSLVSALGAGQIIFFAGIGATENKGACVAVAAMVQYFLMAAFCWMLVEGVYLYLFVVKVYNVSDKLKLCHGVSWSVPAVMVILTLSVASGTDGVESFVSEKYCWMSTSSGLIWVFVSFFVFIEVLNIAILVRVIKEMTSIEQVKDSHADQIRLGIRACVVLIPLLGITWLFGLLSSTHKAFVYIFTILNSAQGFFIFLLHCLRNTEIRERLKRKFRGILPFVTSRTNGVKKESSRVHESSGVLSLKKIKILPIATTNENTES